jgi:tRNA modification GTPase
MKGDLSQKLSGLREQLLRSCSLVELELDFSEEDVQFQSRDELSRQIAELRAEVTRLVDSYQHGRLLAEGVATVIAGRPNAGKSTLLNTLLGQERAIVSHMPGTTRDYIEECFIHDKTMFRLTDTAGLREADVEIEHEGIRRSRMKMAEADLMLYLLDIGSDRLEEEIGDIIDIRQQHPYARFIVVANKIDRVPQAEPLMARVEQETVAEVIGISALEGRGIKELKERMGALVKDLDKLHEASVLVTSLRHYEALRNASDALQNAGELIDHHADTELISFELRSALDYVGEITGKVVNEEILNTIFERFCIGK